VRSIISVGHRERKTWVYRVKLKI